MDKVARYKKITVIILTAVLLASYVSTGCASTGGGGEGLSLLEAVEQSAEKIASELPKGSRVAIVAFDSENDNLSDFIMEEITGALFDRGIEVADRQNLEYVKKELGFQMSGEVSDETAQSIGKFLGAQLVITGQLKSIGGSYRYLASAIHVEKATRASVTRLTVRSDRDMRRMVTTLASQTTPAKNTKYGVSEQAVPKTLGTFLDRGILFSNRGDYEMAIEDFTEALKLDSNLAAAYVLRGRALYARASKVTAEQARFYEQAIEDFTRALRLDPNNVKIYFERGLAYLDKGDNDRAIADYNQAILLNPKYALAYINRGNAYGAKGDNDRAIASYNKAIRLNPKDAVAYNNRGLTYRAKGDNNRAIADYGRAIRLNPNSATAYYNRGNMYFDKKDYDRAIADYNQAIFLNSNYASAYNNRGRAYYYKGDYDRAIADYNQVIRLNPNSAAAYNNRGRAYYGKKNYDRAIADYEAALRIDPNHADAKYNLEHARMAKAKGW
jgi:tetratricopeptide (TPR) repeat protein